MASAPSTRTEATRERRSVPVPWLGSPALGPALPPVPLVLAALLVGAVGARVALAPSRSDAVGALAATVETWTLLGRGGQHDGMAEGDWIRRRVYQECPACAEYADFGPGVLNEARTVETRACPDCGTAIET